MTRITFLLFCLCLPTLVNAQLQRDSIHIIVDHQQLEQVKTADLDVDGDMDIIGSRYGYNGNFVVFKNVDGQGILSLPYTFGDTTWEDRPRTFLNFELGDMDNDGDPDLVSHRMARNSFPYYSNDGSAQFTAPVGGTSLNPIGYDFYFKIIDLNNDGWQDIFIYLSGSKTLAINWNQGAGNGFVYETIEDFESPDFDVFHTIVFNDFDLDGDSDFAIIATAFEADKDLNIYQMEHLGGANFAFASQTTVATSFAFFSNVIVHADDFNQDNWPDYSVSYYSVVDEDSQPYLTFWQNDTGTGNFDQAAVFENYLQHQTADINQDGLLDVFAIFDNDQGYTGRDNQELFAYHWLRNDGDFSFSIDTISHTWAGRAILDADLNGDGFTDLITPGSGSVLSGQMSWWPALDNLGNFAVPIELNVSLDHIQAIQPIDWEQDGDLDLIVGSDNHINECCKDGFYLLSNVDGAGSFGPPQLLFNLEGHLLSANFSDLNQDGQLDIVGNEIIDEPSGGQLIRFFYALTTPDVQNMSLQYVQDTPNFSHQHSSGDMDGDGDPDILIIQPNEDIAIIWNRLAEGEGLVAASSFLTTPLPGGNVRYFKCIDIDGDNFNDLIYGFNESLFWAKHLDGSGNFSEWTELPYDGLGIIGNVIAADIDGDGDIDLKYGQRSELGVIAWILRKYDSESQQFQAPLIVDWNISSIVVRSEPVFDLNHDGAADHIVHKGFIANFPGLGYPAAPVAPYPFQEGLPGILYENALNVDVDGDGQDELIGGYFSIMWHELDFLPNQFVEGLLVNDTTALCTFDSLHPPLKGWNIQMESDGISQLAYTNVDGHYGALLPEASTHLLQPIPISNYWSVCNADTLLTPPLADSPTVVHFSAEANTDCPLLKTEMEVSQVRQCFSSYVSISFQNIGTLPIEDASITLFFDERFTPDESSLPWDIQTDTSLVYQFPEIGIGDVGYIYITLDPDCQALILDEEVCFRLEILPNELCDPMLADWNGAQLEAKAFCEPDSIAFRIANTGLGAMTMPEIYRLEIVNDDIVLFMMDETQLALGEADTIRVERNDQLYRLAMDQPTGHPFPEMISVLANQCAINDSTSYAANLVNNTDGNPFILEVCKPVIGPYDPNIKEAIPMGLGPEHFIVKDWPLHYTIHFQNTGSDVARTVMLHDTLSALLDLHTFDPGPASHDYSWQILPNRRLIITFENINLPDSTSNMEASQGFFSYTIRPLEDVPPLSVIENRAAIFFDFNDPIITNATIHTILKPRVESIVHGELCAGESYLDQPVYQDTIIQELFETPERDSIVWYHLSVLPTPETQIEITLNEPGFWEGIYISQDTSFTITEIAASGCDSLVTFNFQIITATNQPVWAQHITIGPNPTRSKLWLRWDPSQVIPEQVLIYNTLGEILLEQSLPSTNGESVLALDTLSDGAYFVKIRTKEGEYYWPFVKQE